ncbi:thiazole synthase, partial [Staphylococcus arlettae]
MFKIGDFELKARVLLGTGKFDNEAIQTQAIETSETEVLTFAVR